MVLNHINPQYYVGWSSIREYSLRLKPVLITQFYKIQIVNLAPKNSSRLKIHEDSENKERIDRIYQFPAEVNAADLHKRAIKFGYNAPITHNGSAIPICPCCSNLVNNVSIPMCKGTSPVPLCGDPSIQVGQQIFLLDSGTSMYFIFIKMVICHLLLRFFICDIYNLVSSYMGHYCEQNSSQCSGDFYSFLSGYNKHTPEDVPMVDMMDILNLLVTFISIALFYMWRKHQYKAKSVFERIQISQDYFSIFVQNIPIFIIDNIEDSEAIQNAKIDYEKFLTEKIQNQIREWIKKVTAYKSMDEIEDSLDKQLYGLIKTSSKLNIKDQPIVSTISLCYDLAEMETIDDQRQAIMDKHIKKIKTDSNNQDNENYVDDALPTIKGMSKQLSYTSKQLSHVSNQVKILNGKSIQLSNHFAFDRSAPFNLIHFIGKAFVTFRYQHYRGYFLREPEKNPYNLVVKEQSLKIGRAGKPSDVLWRNLKFDNEDKWKKMWTSFFVLILVFIFCFTILLLIDQLQGNFVEKTREAEELESATATNNSSTAATDNHLSSGGPINIDTIKEFFSVDDVMESMAGFINQVSQHISDIEYLKEQAISYIFAFLLPVLINFTNFIIKFFIDQLTKLQKHKSKTDEAIYLIIKNVIWRFVNTAGLYFTIALIHPSTGPLTQEGIVLKVTGLIGFSAFIQAVSQFIAVNSQMIWQWFMGCCPLCCCFKKAPQDQNAQLFQIQKNKQTQLPVFDFAQQYCVFLVQLLVVSFYATLVPLGVGIVALIFIVQYWTSKRNLFQFSSRSDMYSFQLTKFVFKIFEWSLVFFAVGNLIFDSKIHVDVEPKFRHLKWITLAIAGMYIGIVTFASSWVEKTFFQQEEKYDRKPFEHFVQVKAIKRTYWMENPATSLLKEKLYNKAGTKKVPSNMQMVKKQDQEKYTNASEENFFSETYKQEDIKYFIDIGVIKGQEIQNQS